MMVDRDVVVLFTIDKLTESPLYPPDTQAV